jgi:hypothetical protein
MMGEVQEAIKDYRIAVKLLRHSASALNDLGVALYKADEFGEALDAFRGAMRLDPSNIEASNNAQQVAAFLQVQARAAEVKRSEEEAKAAEEVRAAAERTERQRQEQAAAERREEQAKAAEAKRREEEAELKRKQEAELKRKEEAVLKREQQEAEAKRKESLFMSVSEFYAEGKERQERQRQECAAAKRREMQDTEAKRKEEAIRNRREKQEAETKRKEEGKKRHLIVDALNFLSFFVPVHEPGHSKSSPWSLQAVMQQRVALFLRGCALSGLQPHFVIDTGYQSAEALNKWKARREEEVRAEYRGMPCGADVSLAAVLKHQGADVLQPLNLDADDVVARLALAFDGVILSGDRDMVRYEDLDNKSQRVNELFAFKMDGSLVLIPRVAFELRAEPRRADSVSLSLDEWRSPKHKTVDSTTSPPRFVRGNPDSFTKAMGNLNLVARPLRQALYARLGYDVVQETFPEWDKECNKVTWHTTRVAADTSLDALLDDPVRAFEWLANADNNPHAVSAESGIGNKAVHEQQFANAAGMIPPSMSLPFAALDPKAAARAEAAAAARVTQKKLEAAAQALAAQKKRNTPLCRIWRSYSQAMLVAEYCFSARRGDTKNKAALINLVRIAQSVDPFSAEAIATQDPWRIPAHLLEQVCPVCGNYSNCTLSELEFLWSKDIPQPKQCTQCRKRRKEKGQGKGEGQDDGSGGAECALRPTPPRPAECALRPTPPRPAQATKATRGPVLPAHMVRMTQNWSWEETMATRGPVLPTHVVRMMQDWSWEGKALRR